MKSRHRLRTLATAAAAAVALSTTAAPAMASGDSAAALGCSVRVTDPNATPLFGAYSLGEILCDQRVLTIMVHVSLFRDGTLVDFVIAQRNSTNFASEYGRETPCVSGNYHAKVKGFANIDGGAPDFTQEATSQTVAITC